jgi:hypothetical protein
VQVRGEKKLSEGKTEAAASAIKAPRPALSMRLEGSAGEVAEELVAHGAHATGGACSVHKAAAVPCVTRAMRAVPRSI